MKNKFLLGLLVCIIGVSTPCLWDQPIRGSDEYIVQQKVVEFDPRYYYGVNGYYSVAERLKRDKLQELLEQNARMQAQIDLLIKLLGQTPPVVPVSPPIIPPVTPVDPTVDPTVDPPVNPPVVPENPPGNVNDLEQKVYTIFYDSCVNCHGNKDAEKRLQLIDEDKGQLFNWGVARTVDIVQRVERVYLNGKKAMPPSGTTLTDEDVQTLKEWMYTIVDEELQNSN